MRGAGTSWSGEMRLQMRAFRRGLATLPLHRSGVIAVAFLIACSTGNPSVSTLVPGPGAAVLRPAKPPRTIRWSSIGPTLSHGNAGKLNAFAYVNDRPEIMFVAGGWGNTPRESPSQAGIFKSMDGGQHWEPADTGLTNRDGTVSSVVNGLWIDQTSPSIVLAATEFGGTFRSVDGGASWKNIDTSESTQFAQVDSTLYLATRRGILTSTDAGASWSVSLRSALGATSVVAAGGATYAGDAAGNVYRLEGSVWLYAGHPGTGAIHDIAIDPFDTRVVYSNVDDRDAWNEHLYGSIDGGQKWVRVNCTCEVGAQAIAFSKVVPDRLYVGDDGHQTIRYFVANGASHPNIHRGSGIHGNDVRYIIVVPQNAVNGEACYSLTDQGLFYAADCASGASIGLTNAVPNFLAYDVTLPPDRRNIVVPLQDWNALAGSTGGKLHFLRAQEGGESFINPYDSSKCYLAHPDEGLYLSSDGCASFSGPRGRGIESLVFEPPNGERMYAITRDDHSKALVSISTDGGWSWRPAFRSFHEPYEVVVSAARPKSMLVETGTAKTENHVFASSDGGVTWHESTGLPQGGAPAIEQYFPAHQYYAAFAPKTAETVLLADHDPVSNDLLIFRSLDGGLRFTHVATLVQPSTQRPWPDYQLPAEEEHPNRSARYYAERFYGNRLAFDPQASSGCRPPVILTTRFGAFQSFDTGATWRRIDRSAIPHHFIGVTWVNGVVYLASFGGGVIASDDLRGC
jgi:hypothetical protein